MTLTPKEALDHLETLYREETEGGVASLAWQTLKSAASEQTAHNNGYTKCCCEYYHIIDPGHGTAWRRKQTTACTVNHGRVQQQIV